MIKLTHATKRDGIQFYYYHRQEHYDSAISSIGTSVMRQKAHTVYDENARKFTKERMGRAEIMNAMLLLHRNRHYITDEMRELVNEHA